MANQSLPPDRIKPHPDRLSESAPDYGKICERHEAAIRAGDPLYEDPGTGLWVMTAATLWAKACCDNGCRHCPHIER